MARGASGGRRLLSSEVFFGQDLQPGLAERFGGQTRAIYKDVLMRPVVDPVAPARRGPGFEYGPLGAGGQRYRHRVAGSTLVELGHVLAGSCTHPTVGTDFG
jgi:hypothetical protein